MAKKSDYKEELEYQRRYATSRKRKNESNPNISEGRRQANRATWDKVIRRAGGAYPEESKGVSEGASELLEGIGLLRRAARKAREGYGSLQELGER